MGFPLWGVLSLLLMVPITFRYYSCVQLSLNLQHICLFISINAFNKSSLQTYPHASAAKCSITNSHQQERVEIPISVFPMFPRHPELTPFPCWQWYEKHVKSLLCLLIMFILYVWTRSFADLKCRNRVPSLLPLSFLIPLLTARTGAGVCSRPWASS